MRLFGPKDIKFHVKEYLLAHESELRGKVVVDIPAGNGVSSAILRDIGAAVEPYDLFPGFFRVSGLECMEADLSQRLPIQDQHADVVLCQEGVEHLPDPFHVFREFGRILKKDGTLIITTPNHSNLRSRVSYYLAESEFFYKIMPPNEVDSIWFSDREKSIYFGHVFLVGIMKLRLLAKLAGFRIKEIHHLRVNHTALALLVVSYPLIALVNLLAYWRAVGKRGDEPAGSAKAVYRELLRLGTDPRILTDSHLLVEFVKECEPDEAASGLRNKYEGYDIVT